ncbi:U3 small nucleolar ribonucleoprotein protein MPP10 [Bactrocera neohumeralis]|uniref:U3 small nucleolar ribonucleoprotein protein MPP10 n=1 Tax=Bactrocera neohumeralis TaxID=98809 RepID=UPI0021666BD0|nr:U3 small nucleolar ribonucleoprotein protein MPP10 [Bactrocera neohumeralis]
MGTVEKDNFLDNEALNEITTEFKNITEDPTQFLLVSSSKKQEDIKTLLQKTYQACVRNDESSKNALEILPELVVEDMDEEQIWQQLELRNNTILTALVENASKLLSLKEEKLEVRLDEDDNQEIEEELEQSESEAKDNSGDADLFNGEVDDESDEEQKVFQKKQEVKKKRKGRTSVVDDKFFKLSEMEAFLEDEDAKEMRRKNKKGDNALDATVDYFADDLGIGDEEEDDEDANPTYQDFFDEEDEDVDVSLEKPTKKQKDHFKEVPSEDDEDMSVDGNEDDEEEDAEDDSEDENMQSEDENPDSDNEVKTRNEGLQPASSGTDDSEDEEDHKEPMPQSSFEIRQERLQQRIREYEEEVLGEKPWQLRGEIQATSRPANSLLEELLEFESTVRPAPVITEHTTRCLEDIIKQRIKDKAWDDPQPKLKPLQSPHEFRKQLILDQEKSKESLAQVYEKEYQKELDKFDPNRADAGEEEPKEHKEIKQLMRALFVKLDALSNFHFTPKPVAPEARIITNTPAVNMEEVAPVAISDAKLLAPEEVYRGPKNELVGKTERNRTDKNRERRKKKQKQRVINRLLDEKSKKKQELGIAPTKKEENAKLLKSLTKHRNVEKLNTTSDDQRALKSSKSFFSKLQDTTSVAGQAAIAAKAKKQKSTGKTLTAKRVKL